MFTTAFSLRTIILTWIFFKILWNEIKIFSKRDACHLKVACHSNRQKKNIEKIESRRKTINISLLVTFLEKIIFY